MDIAPALTPFWYEPAKDPKVPEKLRPRYEGVRLKMAPLTFPQKADIEATPRFLTSLEGQVFAMYRAGGLALREIEGITIGGRKAVWPDDRDMIDNDLLAFAGSEVMRQANATLDQIKN